MQFSMTNLGKLLAQAIGDSLKSDSVMVKSLTLAEGRKLAIALSEIARLLARGEIDGEEAAMLVRVQKAASEAVLASLADVGRMAASRAVGSALKSVLETAARGSGPSIVATLLKGVLT